MGKFETISVEGIKSYTLFSKDSFNKVLAFCRSLPLYSLYGEGKDVTVEIYLDSPNNLLRSAGIILTKVIEDNKACLRVEREEYIPGRKNLFKKEKKVFIHPIGLKDTAFDHSLFLIDGISSMFSTKFHIDLDNVLKTVVPKLEIESRRDHFKVFSGKGFKAEMIYENIRVKNHDTKRRVELLMLDIVQTSSKINLNEFNDFTFKIEKYCKEVLPIEESKYEIAMKKTQIVVPKK
ncbi:MAG: hypothetical protein PHS54_03975 [Clostridia bacterium]|nr:hypothetical protein [Clostridia bacterium]